ncbi:MAG: DUF2500 domain-containing protein [Propionibacteriaceae bacterium]|jgi:hypothetical protein|nr:DUF2500 domain-containing protein [Propionibacteriaceae bacterium]
MSIGPIIAVSVFLCVVFVLIVVGLVLGIAGSRGRRQRRLNMKAPLLNSPARVIDKRTAVAGSGGEYASTSTSYFVTFELPDGQRLELAVDGHVTGQIVAGDAGTLYWQGTWFKGFQREILR